MAVEDYNIKHTHWGLTLIQREILRATKIMNIRINNWEYYQGIIII